MCCMVLVITGNIPRLVTAKAVFPPCWTAMGPALTVTAKRADSNVILNFILKEGNVKMDKKFSTFFTEKR